jgi:hypothetical protein
MKRRATLQGKLSETQTSHLKEEGINMSIIEKIEAHEKQVLAGQIPENLTCCEFCNEPSSSIKRHDARLRIFYYVIECYVYRKESWLGRWRCVICRKIFTYYPGYCLPYKRYVKTDIVKFSARYLHNEKISYRSSLKHNFNVIVHKDKEQTKQCEFCGTTIWRWQSFLSGLIKLEKKALQLIREKSSECSVFREVYSINKRKYRTVNRKTQLLNAMKLLKVEELFNSIFGATIFPQFASRYG